MQKQPLSFVHAFVWTFGVVVVLVLGLSLSTQWRPSIAGNAGLVGGWFALVHALGAMAVLRGHSETNGFAGAFGLRPTATSLLPAAALLGLVAHVPSASLEYLVNWWSPTPARILAERAALFGGESPRDMAVALLMLGCISPFFQELYYRGALYAGLRRSSGATAAAIVTGLCFMIGHPDLRAWLPISLMAFLLSHLRLVSGSVLPPLCFHVVFNSSTIYLVTTGTSGPGGVLDLWWGWHAIGWLTTIALAYFTHRLGRMSGQSARARAEDAA